MIVSGLHFSCMGIIHPLSYMLCRNRSLNVGRCPAPENSIKYEGSFFQISSWPSIATSLCYWLTFLWKRMDMWIERRYGCRWNIQFLRFLASLCALGSRNTFLWGGLRLRAVTWCLADFGGLHVELKLNSWFHHGELPFRIADSISLCQPSIFKNTQNTITRMILPLGSFSGGKIGGQVPLTLSLPLIHAADIDPPSPPQPDLPQE